MKKNLSKLHCGFREGYGTHHCLLLMLEKRKKALANQEAFVALLTDLSKAFDCLNHNFLTSKMHAYYLSLSSLKLVHDYLLNRKQRTTSNWEYSSWTYILEGAPQASILGSLLCNMFFCDLLIITDTTYFASLADDNATYIIRKTVAMFSALQYALLYDETRTDFCILCILLFLVFSVWIESEIKMGNTPVEFEFTFPL